MLCEYLLPLPTGSTVLIWKRKNFPALTASKSFEPHYVIPSDQYHLSVGTDYYFDSENSSDDAANGGGVGSSLVWAIWWITWSRSIDPVGPALLSQWTNEFGPFSTNNLLLCSKVSYITHNGCTYQGSMGTKVSILEEIHGFVSAAKGLFYLSVSPVHLLCCW